MKSSVYFGDEKLKACYEGLKDSQVEDKMLLPKGWRLIYSVANDGVCIISILLEWMDHKNYERRFNY
jgi:hypothetical protein